jgi:enoyl-CoA hydratase
MQAQELGLARLARDVETIGEQAVEIVAMAPRGLLRARRITKSADLELGPAAVRWTAAIELECAGQMWSLGRQGETGWRTPVKPTGG